MPDQTPIPPCLKQTEKQTAKSNKQAPKPCSPRSGGKTLQPSSPLFTPPQLHHHHASFPAPYNPHCTRRCIHFLQLHAERGRHPPDPTIRSPYGCLREYTHILTQPQTKAGNHNHGRRAALAYSKYTVQFSGLKSAGKVLHPAGNKRHWISFLTRSATCGCNDWVYVKSCIHIFLHCPSPYVPVVKLTLQPCACSQLT
jgi:hypothetical protein